MWKSRRSRTVLTIALAALASCSGGESGITGVPDESAAKGGGGGKGGTPQVASTSPPYAYQGDALTVVISGSGFDVTSVASWERDGVPESRIAVRATRFVSSSRLEADVAVAADADLALYDVAVTNTTSAGGRKKGIGVELFEVTTAQSIGTLGGTTNVWSLSDVTPYSAVEFVAAGYSFSGSTRHAVLWTPTHGLRSLGAGVADAIDAGGTAVLGTVDGLPAIRWLTWTGSGVTSTVEPLPYPAWGSGVSRAVDLGSGADGRLRHVAGQIRRKLGKRSTTEHPALWTRGGSGQWTMGAWAIDTFTTPPGFASGWIEDVADDGAAVGTMRTSGGVNRPYRWSDLRTPVPLALPAGYDAAQVIGLAADGGVAVGQLLPGGPAVYWAAAEGWTPVLLSSECAGWAWSVAATPVGTVVTGKACEQPVRWILPDDPGGTIAREYLGTLGNRAAGGSGYAVNGSGFIGGRAGDHGAYWFPALAAFGGPRPPP